MCAPTHSRCVGGSGGEAAFHPPFQGSKKTSSVGAVSVGQDPPDLASRSGGARDRMAERVGFRGGSAPRCEYCGDRAAAVYCRADAARLCLACDRHVHAANALSRRHHRSRLCSGCSAAPAAVRCAHSSCLLSLCTDCDAAHHPPGASPQHVGHPLEVFTGCPSAPELSTLFGLDLDLGKQAPAPHLRDIHPGPLDQVFGGWDAILAVDPVLQELYVPCAAAGGGGRGAVVEQLAELAASEKESAGLGGMSPRTPDEEKEKEKEKQKGEEMNYTSLLMLPRARCSELKGSDRLVEDEDVLWDCGPTDHPAQVR